MIEREREQFSIILQGTAAARLGTEYGKSLERYHDYESFSECLFIRRHQARCPPRTPDVIPHALTATDSYESLWVFCTVIAQLMMQLLMRAVTSLASGKDETKNLSQAAPKSPKSLSSGRRIHWCCHTDKAKKKCTYNIQVFVQ